MMTATLDEVVPTVEVTDLVALLADELATEIEMHYDKSEYYTMVPTICVLRQASDYLTGQEIPVPEAVAKVIRDHASQLG